MAVNYNDERFQQVENEKQEQLNQYNQTYDDLLAEREELTQQQQDLVNQWQQTQNENLDKQLQYQQDLINQQKEAANKQYQDEARSAYTDYRKEIDRYGVSREQQVANGLGNTGYSESSNVSMYNTYQNRLGTAKESLSKAYLEFDNAIREAQLTNDVTKAENALTALQQNLQIALEGFNYKDTTTQNKLNWQQQINSDYYNRYQNVLNQINYENEQAEALRQYNEQMAFQREQAQLAQQQWEKEYALQQQQLAYQKEQDRIANAQTWASINASKNSSSSYDLTDGKGTQIVTDYWQGTINPDTQYGTFGTVDKNGVRYQPDNVGGSKLKSTGKKVRDYFGEGNQGSTGANIDGQTMWTTNGRYYIWDGSQNRYIDVTSQIE